MIHPELREFGSGSLSYVLSVPGGARRSGAHPVLCFLHGHDEGPPTSLRPGVTRHGPLAATASPLARSAFVIVAPQLPTRGDHWRAVADEVLEIVRVVRAEHDADPDRAFLTGFSYGANGVFDLALAHPSPWAALWPVDPTRVPPDDPGRPIWLSSGKVSRRGRDAFIERLRLVSVPGEPDGDRIYLDQGQDHVGTAQRAYADERIYRWLLGRRSAGS